MYPDTPEYDQSPLERRVNKMSAGEAKRVLIHAMDQWARLDADVREEAESVLPEEWLERDENGNPDILNVVKRLVSELKEARA